MKKYLIVVGFIFFLFLSGLGTVAYIRSHIIGSEREPTLPEIFVAETAGFHKSKTACMHISPNAVTVMENSTPGSQKYNTRSECLQLLAIATNNPSLCSEIKSPWFNEKAISRSGCEEYVLNVESYGTLFYNRNIDDLYIMIGYDVPAEMKARSIRYTDDYFNPIVENGIDEKTLNLIEAYDLSVDIDRTEFTQHKIDLVCNAGLVDRGTMCSRRN